MLAVDKQAREEGGTSGSERSNRSQTASKRAQKRRPAAALMEKPTRTAEQHVNGDRGRTDNVFIGRERRIGTEEAAGLAAAFEPVLDAALQGVGERDSD